MRYLVGIIAAALIGLSTYLTVVREAIFSIADKLPVLLAVLLAAVLVRLARGLPTIPFDKIRPAQAFGATAAFRLLLQSYTQCLFVITGAILLNLFAKSLHEGNPWPSTLAIYSFVLLFMDVLSIIVVYFLVSADIKISLIQADLMDQVTGASSTTSAGVSADKVRGAFKTNERDSPSITRP